MENIDDWRMRASIAESEAATLRVEVERLREVMDRASDVLPYNHTAYHILQEALQRTRSDIR